MTTAETRPVKRMLKVSVGTESKRNGLEHTLRMPEAWGQFQKTQEQSLSIGPEVDPEHCQASAPKDRLNNAKELMLFNKTCSSTNYTEASRISWPGGISNKYPQIPLPYHLLSPCSFHLLILLPSSFSCFPLFFSLAKMCGPGGSAETWLFLQVTQ